MKRSRQIVKPQMLIGERTSYILPAQETLCSHHGWFSTRIYQATWADDTDQASRVIVKEYMPSTQDAIQEERLMQAIRCTFATGMMLEHPHVCKTRELIEDRYIVYDWAGDTHLQQFLRPNQALQVSYEAALSLCGQLASALCYLYQTLMRDHSNGFCGYGDLHPYNVMIREQSSCFVATLIDFDNLCRRSDPSAPRGDAQDFLSGTRALYDAPELLLGVLSHADVLSDIFSLGMLFYRLLFDEWPYENVEDYPELLHAIQHRKSVSYKPWNRSQEAEGHKECPYPSFDLSLLHRIISHMIAPYREDRYGSFEVVVQALAAIEPPMKKE